MTKNPWVSRCVLSVVLCAWATAVHGVAGEDTPPVDAPPQKQWKRLTPDQLVSENSIFYIATADFTKAKKAFMRSAFFGLLSEDEMLRELRDIFSNLEKSYEQGTGAASEFEQARRRSELDMLKHVTINHLEEHVVLAVDVPPTPVVVAGAPPPTTPKPRFMVVLSIPAGEDAENKQLRLRDKFDNFASDMLRDSRFKDTQPPIRVGDYEIQELECKELDLHESWAFVENLFVYGQGKGIVQEAVTNYAQNRGRGTLSQSNGYHAAVSRVADNAQLYLQMDASAKIKAELEQRPNLKAVLAPIMQNWEQNRPQVAMGAYVTEGDNAPIREKLLLRVAHKGQPAPCKNVTALLASSDALFYHAHQGTLADLLRPLAALGAVVPAAPVGTLGVENPTAGKNVVKLSNFMPLLMRAVNAGNEDEVWKTLEPFQGELGVFMNYLPGESLEQNLQDVFQFVFALEVRPQDLQAASDTLEKLKRATRLEYKKISWQGEEVYYQLGAKPDEAGRGGRVVRMLDPILPFQTLPERSMEGTPFFVSYALIRVVPPTPGERERNFLLLSDNLQALQKAVQQSKVARQRLVDRKEFKDQVASFSDSRYAISFLDLPRLSDALYHTIFPAMTRKRMLDKKDFRRLPPDNIVRKHMSPMAWASSAPSEGSLYEFVSPTGNLTLVSLVGALAIPALNNANRDQVSKNVDRGFQEVGLAVHLYAADFDRFPQQLSELVPAYISFNDFRRVFNSPFNPDKVVRPQDVDDPEKTNLVYVPGRALQDLSKEVMLFEVQPTKIETTNFGISVIHHVLRLDGKVRSASRQSLISQFDGKTGIVTHLQADVKR